MLKRIVEQCKDCCLPDFSEGYCTAFQDPAYQWRNGECWGRCDAEEMVRRLQAIIRYNEGHGMNTAGVAKLKKELASWQKTVRVLKGGANSVARKPPWDSSRARYKRPGRNPWTPEEWRLMERMRIAGKSTKEIAKRLGRTENAVDIAWCRYGPSPEYRKRRLGR